MSLKSAKFSCGTISQLKDSLRELLKECDRKNELAYNFTFDDRVKRNLVNESYYIRINDIQGINQEGCLLETSTDVEICLYYQCGKLEPDTQERALIDGEGVLVHILDPKNRPECFQYISFLRMRTEALSETNESIIKVCLEFEIRQALRIDAII